MKTATTAEMPHSIAAPQPPRSPTEKPSEPSRKPGIRERDHEAVVPAKRLEELLFLDYCCRHINLRLECRERCERSRVAREPTTVVGGFLAL